MLTIAKQVTCDIVLHRDDDDHDGDDHNNGLMVVMIARQCQFATLQDAFTKIVLQELNILHHHISCCCNGSCSTMQHSQSNRDGIVCLRVGDLQLRLSDELDTNSRNRLGVFLTSVVGS